MPATPEVYQRGDRPRLTFRFLLDETHRLTVTGTPTGGGVTLTFDGETTDQIPFDAQAVTVEDALAALASVLPGNVYASGGPWPGTPVDVTWIEALGKRRRELPVLAVNALTGGSSPGLTIARQVAGGMSQPTTVTFTITSPTGVDTAYTWTGVDNQIVREGPGQFHVDWDVVDAAPLGLWTWSAKGDGGVEAVAEREFYVVERRAVA